MDAAILSAGGVLLSAALAGVGWSFKQIVAHEATLAALAATQRAYREESVRNETEIRLHLSDIEKKLDRLLERDKGDRHGTA